MDKNKIVKIGSLIGIAAAAGYRLFHEVKKIKKEQDIIDVTPEEQIEEISQN